MITGTLLYTWLFGKLVGTDEFGNRYYHNPGQKLHGKERRWVMFKGDREASKVPPEWHAWLHHTVAEPLAEKAANAKAWQKEHEPNLTGSVAAYRPGGHELRGGTQGPETGVYEAWRPDAG